MANDLARRSARKLIDEFNPPRNFEVRQVLPDMLGELDRRRHSAWQQTNTGDHS